MIGKYISFIQENGEEIRQGLCIDKKFALYEDGQTAKIGEIVNVIEDKNLLPETAVFVRRWREVNGI